MNISIFEMGITVLVTLFILLFLNLYRPRSVRVGLMWFICLGTASIAAFYLAYYLSYQLNPLVDAARFAFFHSLGYAGYGWIMTLLMVLIPFAVLGLVRLGVTLYNRKFPEEQRMSRRSFFRSAALALPAVTFTGSTGLAVRTTYDMQVTQLRLKYKDLPEYLQGYRIGQISDSHIGTYFSLAQMEEAVNRLAEDKVHRVVITGDVIDDVRLLPGLCEILEAAFDRFPDGIDYIYGNHEYYRNLGAIENSFAKLRMRIHRNTNMRIDTGKGQPVYLAGVDYPFQKTVVKSYLEEALTGIPNSAFILLLAHHPDFLEEAFSRGIPFTFAGHTHGGQINVGDVSLVPMNYEYWRGLYKSEETGARGYVSTGAGNWFPVRMNCPREITVVSFAEGADENRYNEYV